AEAHLMPNAPLLVATLCAAAGVRASLRFLCIHGSAADVADWTPLRSLTHLETLTVKGEVDAALASALPVTLSHLICTSMTTAAFASLPDGVAYFEGRIEYVTYGDCLLDLPLRAWPALRTLALGSRISACQAFVDKLAVAAPRLHSF